MRRTLRHINSSEACARNITRKQHARLTLTHKNKAECSATQVCLHKILKPYPLEEWFCVQEQCRLHLWPISFNPKEEALIFHQTHIFLR